MQQEYIPGVCNIGPAEIRLRWTTGWIGYFFTTLIWLGFIINSSPAAWRLALIVPAYVSAIGFLQASLHFCVAFGAKGLFNFNHKIGKVETVDQQEFRAKDQAKAVKLMLIAFVIALAVALIAYAL